MKRHYGKGTIENGVYSFYMSPKTTNAIQFKIRNRKNGAEIKKAKEV